MADNAVRALTVTGDRTKVVAGGSFVRINGLVSNGMQAIDASSGVRRRWNINTVVKDYGSNAAILSLAADGDTVYGTGYGFGGGNFEGVFAADDSAGDIRWLQDCHGDTYSVAPAGSVIYSVSHAHFCANIGGFPEFTPRRHQRALAVTRNALGTVAPNSQPGAHYGNFGGRPAPSIYNWFPEVNAGTFTGMSQGAWSVVASTDYVMLGGEFTQVNGVPQQGLVRFARPGKAPERQGPVDRSAVTAPSVSASTGGTAAVYLAVQLGPGPADAELRRAPERSGDPHGHRQLDLLEPAHPAHHRLRATGGHHLPLPDPGPGQPQQRAQPRGRVHLPRGGPPAAAQRDRADHR